MRNLVQALISIIPRLGAITALLLLIFYIFGVLFTELFGDLDLSGEYFTRLDYSLLTLFTMMTMEWSDIARECMAQVSWAWVPFVSFIMITGFIVFNLIIAVVCDAVAVLEENKGDSHSESEKDYDGPLVNTKNINQTTIKEDIVEVLADQFTSALSNQKKILSTLEALINCSMLQLHLVPNETSPCFVKNEMSQVSLEEKSVQ